MKVKILESYARNENSMPELEKKINEFIADKKVKDIKFQVARDFLLGSTLGEFEEFGYGMVIYE